VASETLPLVNEYGCLHTSQVFFLLWESHVVKLNGISARSGEYDRSQDIPILVNVPDRARAFARMKERLIWFCRCAADSASVLVRVTLDC